MTPKSRIKKEIKCTKQKAKDSEKDTSAAPNTAMQTSSEGAITSKLQQYILDTFRYSFIESFDDALPTTIQEVKGHLYNRNFSKAFENERNLQAYAVRWSPSRALAYLNLLYSLPYDLTMQPLENQSPADLATTHPNHCVTSRAITCFGGGCAEILALAGYMHLIAKTGRHLANSKLPDEPASTAAMTLRLVDIADWSSVIDKLYRGATMETPISKYAGQGSQTKSGSLVEAESFSTVFAQQDILSMGIAQLRNVLRDTFLVTLFFTLNELYSTSMNKTANFLLTLTYLTKPGTLLLVIDSPGSYSTVQVKRHLSDAATGSEKKYPMKWLLDHTLLEASSVEGSKNTTQTAQWEKLASEDSKWFRLSDDLQYPLDLEDMRYQYHLFRHI